jgi:hypothetical protein
MKLLHSPAALMLQRIAAAGGDQSRSAAAGRSAIRAATSAQSAA